MDIGEGDGQPRGLLSFASHSGIHQIFIKNYLVTDRQRGAKVDRGSVLREKVRHGRERGRAWGRDFMSQRFQPGLGAVLVK